MVVGYHVGLSYWLRVSFPGIEYIEPISYFCTSSEPFWGGGAPPSAMFTPRASTALPASIGMTFAVLTLVWEIFYVTVKFDNVVAYSTYLRESGTHVWLTVYGWQVILPWNTAEVFYGEYGAWADREYSSVKHVENAWARVVEGSHGLTAGGFSILAIVAAAFQKYAYADVATGVAMAMQFMNAFLYTINYLLDLKDPRPNLNTPTVRGGGRRSLTARPQCSPHPPSHENCCAHGGAPTMLQDEFPIGILSIKRPFMYVNIPWVVMPTYVIIRLLVHLWDGTAWNGTPASC